MGIDICNCTSGVAIKHGISTLHIPDSGVYEYQTLENDVINTPVIGDMEENYSGRFDDTTYYTA